MNVLGLCQGANLKIFHNLLKEDLVDKNSKIGVFIADAFYYVNKFESKFDNKKFILLKEWEVINFALTDSYEQDINKWIHYFKESSLWESVLADRRIIHGSYCKVKQDYKSKYSHEEIIKIVSYSLDEIDELFKKLKPNLIIGFAPVTLIEHLILKYAEKNNIKYYLIRSSKIDNNVILYDNMHTLSSKIKNLILSKESLESEKLDSAKKYIDKIRNSGHNIYEGITDPKNYFKSFNIFYILKRFASSFYNFFKKRNNSITRVDNHNPNFIISTYYSEIVKLFRSYKFRKFINSNALELNHNQKYCFYPLHTEPEIAIQINGRVLTNQIEVIRNIALSLPINYKLIVKEHPRSFGMRKINYYKKITEIPNVYLCPLGLSVTQVLDFSDLVFTISGSVGLEALIKKNPVILLGYQDIEIFPKTMLRKVHNLYKLSFNVKDILLNYKHDESFLLRYVASVLKMSKKIDLYSTLLNKKGRVSFDSSNYKKNISSLNDLIKLYMYEEL